MCLLNEDRLQADETYGVVILDDLVEHESSKDCGHTNGNVLHRMNIACQNLCMHSRPAAQKADYTHPTRLSALSSSPPCVFGKQDAQHAREIPSRKSGLRTML